MPTIVSATRRVHLEERRRRDPVREASEPLAPVALAGQDLDLHVRALARVALDEHASHRGGPERVAERLGDRVARERSRRAPQVDLDVPRGATRPAERLDRHAAVSGPTDSGSRRRAPWASSSPGRAAAGTSRWGRGDRSPPAVMPTRGAPVRQAARRAARCGSGSRRACGR